MELMPVLGSAAIVLAVGLLWWAVSGRRADVPVDLTTGRPVADLRVRRLAEPVADRAVRPMVERIGAAVRGLLPSRRSGAIATRLQRAGSPEGWTVERVLAAKLLGALLLGLLLLVRLLVDPTMLNVLLVALAAGVGWFVPSAVLDSRVRSRQDAVRREMSDVIDQLAVMVRAGLSIDAAIVRATKSGHGAMIDELHRVVQEMRVGVNRRTALANMAERCDVPELRSFVAALAQADQLGVPVSDTLHMQAAELRLKQRQLAEEAAMKLPVKILFPMVLFILPVIFIVLLGPAAIRIMDELL